MKYLITNYKGHDIYYNDDAALWEAFESADIKKDSLREIKVVIEINLLPKKHTWLHINTEYNNELHYEKVHVLTVDKIKYIGNVEYLWTDGSGNTKLIPNTKENVLWLKKLQKDLKTATEARGNAYQEHLQVFARIEKEIKNVTKS